jgi:hypothetical protein
MFSSFRKNFGVTGVIAVVALVFAMAGGAWAAKKYVITSTSQIKPSVLKSLQGKTGPAGANGNAGSNGKDGARGADGTNGGAGANGKSVTASAASPAECMGGVGGTKFEVEGSGTSSKVCNGKNGTTGFTETLPTGKTETGTWGVTRGTAGSVSSPVSLSIPLAESPELVFVAMVKYEEFSEEFFEPELKQAQEEGAENGCPGINSEGLPMAEPGTLCVYGNFLLQMKPGGTGLARTKLPSGPAAQIFLNGGFTPKPAENGEPGGSGTVTGAGPMGTTLTFECSASCQGGGAWAATAE